MARQGPETRLARQMDDAAKKKYGERLVSVNQHGSAFTANGVSDRLLCLDGVFVAIEIKAPDNYGNSVERAVEKGPTVKQRLFIEKVTVAGGIAGVAASVEQYMALLKMAERRAKKRKA